MALIILSGFPCSGKTFRAHQIKEMLEFKLKEESIDSQPTRVMILNDESLGVHRSAYNDSKTEKVARASLLSQTIRKLNKDHIVICDGMNYIKGFRYQLYCAAREAGVRTCTIHVANSPERCLAWNALLPEEYRYKEETIHNLFSRYEEPDASVRWDSPLIVFPWCDALIRNLDNYESSHGETEKQELAHKLPGLRVLGGTREKQDSSTYHEVAQLAPNQKDPNSVSHELDDSDVANPVVGAISQATKHLQPWSRIAEDIWAATTKGILKPIHAAVKKATQTSPNFLHVLETTTVSILTNLLTTINNSSSKYGVVSFSCVLPISGKLLAVSITIPIGKAVNIGVLQRLKRQYTTMHKQANASGRGTAAEDEVEIADGFVKYVQSAL